MRVLQQTTQTGSVWDCPAGRSNEERGTEGDKNCSGEIFHECVSVKKKLSHLMQWLTLLYENQSRASSRCWILHFSSCEFNCMRCSKKNKSPYSDRHNERLGRNGRNNQHFIACLECSCQSSPPTTTEWSASDRRGMMRRLQTDGSDEQ